MKKFLAAAAFVTALSQPAMATTFPALTTIYIGLMAPHAQSVSLYCMVS